MVVASVTMVNESQRRYIQDDKNSGSGGELVGEEEKKEGEEEEEGEGEEEEGEEEEEEEEDHVDVLESQPRYFRIGC